MNQLTQLFFSRRGYTPEFLNDIENPVHGNLKDVDVLADALLEIHDNHETIVVLPDFDMDGIASGVLGIAGLCELGFDAYLYSPKTDKYGFSESDIDAIMTLFPNVKAIITCDVGSSCYDAVAYGKAKGIKMLVTDHHTVSGSPIKADVFVNPMRSDDEYEHKGICGAYVLYQCLQYYADKYYDALCRERISLLRVFAGIGTVSDSMPVLYENRALIRDAISICRYIYAEGSDTVVNMIAGHPVYCNAFRGLYCVLRMFETEGKISCPDNIDESFFGFYLAPMFNSVKRLNGDMRLAFGAFYGLDREDCIAKLNLMNEERKSMVDHYLTEILDSCQSFAPFIYITDAPSGILGLLATKLLRLTGVPALVLRVDDESDEAGCVVYRGSGRSPEWYSFMSRVKNMGPDGVVIEGHQLAFGIKMHDFVLPILYSFLQSDVHSVFDTLEHDAQPYDIVISTLGDGDIGLNLSVLHAFVRDMNHLKPFGRSFAKPNILLKFKVSDGEWSVIGSNKQHLKIILPYGFSVLCWNQAAVLNSTFNGNDIVRVTGDVDENEFMGNTSVVFVGDFSGVTEVAPNE